MQVMLCAWLQLMKKLATHQLNTPNPVKKVQKAEQKGTAATESCHVVHLCHCLSSHACLSFQQNQLMCAHVQAVVNLGHIQGVEEARLPL